MTKREQIMMVFGFILVVLFISIVVVRYDEKNEYSEKRNKYKLEIESLVRQQQETQLQKDSLRQIIMDKNKEIAEVKRMIQDKTIDIFQFKKKIESIENIDYNTLTDSNIVSMLERVEIPNDFKTDE